MLLFNRVTHVAFCPGFHAEVHGCIRSIRINLLKENKEKQRCNFCKLFSKERFLSLKVLPVVKKILLLLFSLFLTRLHGTDLTHETIWCHSALCGFLIKLSHHGRV